MALADTVAACRSAILGLPIEARVRLADLFTKEAIEAARLDQRDDALARMAVGLVGTDNAKAEEIARRLLRYRATADWRGDRRLDAPRADKHLLEWRVLQLSGGEPLAARTIRERFKKLADRGRCGRQQPRQS